LRWIEQNIAVGAQNERRVATTSQSLCVDTPPFSVKRT
jgi:hypothetical protein